MHDSILITGGAGFVGSSLALYLKEDYPEIEVVVLDNLKRHGSELNLPRLRAAGIKFIHGDIRNSEDFDQINNVELLIDCAAEPSILAGYDLSPNYILNTNLLGTINTLELARKHQTNIIFLSTSRVYPFNPLRNLHFVESETRLIFEDKEPVTGISQKGISEEFPLNGARTLYGTSKLSSEMLLIEYLDMYNMKGVINRCGVITGPWQMGRVDQGFVVLWVAKHIFGGRLNYIGYGGEGKQVRDILHVRDLYRLLKIQINNISHHNSRIYNVGGGNGVSVSLLELTEECQQATGQEIRIDSVAESRSGDIPYYVSDCSKVSEATGWEPRSGVKEIVGEIAHWINENRGILKPIFG